MRKGYKRMLWILWLLAVVILIVIVYIFPGITGSLTKTYLAEYDNVFVSDQVECYLVRDEVVTYAKNSGATTYYYVDGTKIRKYTIVMKVGAVAEIEAESGTISYYIDGEEERFNPQTLDSLDRHEVERLRLSTENLVADTVESGQAIYKTIRGNTWNLIFWRDKETVIKYIKGNTVTMLLGDSKIMATVSQIIEQGNEFMVVLETNRFYDEYTTARRLDAEIVTINEQGLRLKSESLVTIDGQPGVYVKGLNGAYKFTPVKIYMLSGEDVLVARDSYNVTIDNKVTRVSTIKAYDEILTNGASFHPAEERNE